MPKIVEAEHETEKRQQARDRRRGRTRQERLLMTYPEPAFRRAFYSLCKSLQAQEISLPDHTQDFVNHVEKPKRNRKK